MIKDRAAEAVDIARSEIAKWPIGKPISVFPAFQNIIAEQMGHLMAGFSPGGYMKDLTTLIRGLLLSSAAFPHIMKLPRFRRARTRAEELSREVLAHKQRNGPCKAGLDFVDLMLELREADPQLLPETNLALTVLAPFLVGLDTTASTSSFMLYNVLKHPELMDRMTAEADAFFEQDLVPGEGLRRLDISRRVAMETLRLHPVSPAVLRTVANSFEFEGHTVPAGTLVMVATSVGHFLEEHFPDPERFDIDRYSSARGEQRQRGAYAPFGAGTHRCLGSGLVPVQLGLNMATILRELVLQPLDPNHALRVRSFPTMQPVGFKVRAVGRRNPGESMMDRN